MFTLFASVSAVPWCSSTRFPFIFLLFSFGFHNSPTSTTLFSFLPLRRSFSALSFTLPLGYTSHSLPSFSLACSLSLDRLSHFPSQFLAYSLKIKKNPNLLPYIPVFLTVGSNKARSGPFILNKTSTVGYLQTVRSRPSIF